MNWSSFLFLVFALLAGGFAIAVVISSNIVRMAFYLVLSLAATSGLFFLAGADFVGAMQLMIYVGGTLVLLIFGVMLTSSSPFVSMRTNSGELVSALLVGGTLLGLLCYMALGVPQWQSPAIADASADQPTVTATLLGAALEGYRFDQLDEPDPLLRGGMSGYLFPFIIVSVHLLVVLIGASYLARAKRRSNSSSLT
jgi:NADH:ubiquinone oxidoreductase subunit 6 (subunit J)